ncbi:hypothetical protein BKA93DRAFT_729644 [Sparassis latifolia]
MSSNALFQNAYYIGNNFNGILYGIELILYFSTIKALLRSDRLDNNKSRIFFICFSTALLLLNTIYVAAEAVFGEEMWIVNADYPGGSAAYLEEFASVWYQTLGSTASILMNLLTDGLLIYRCFVVWNDHRVIFLPCFMWIATFGLGITELYASGAPSGDFFAGLAEDIGIAYYSTSICMNVIVTCLICGRVIYLGRIMQRNMRVSHYTGAIPIIIESAIPYTLFGIAFLVSYGLGSGISILFMSIYVMFTCISPQLIILRVNQGQAWTRGATIDTLSALALQTMEHTNAYTTDHGDAEVGRKLDKQSESIHTAGKSAELTV